MNVAVILAGGSGSRFGSRIPKQFMSLNGKLVYEYAIDAFYETKLFDKIIFVLDKQHLDIVKKNSKISHLVAGGKTRAESVNNALKYIKTLSNVKNIVFHDAARPFIVSDEIKQYIDALKKAPVVVTAQKITDALFYAPRDKYKLIQTPEAFRYSFLKNNFNYNDNAIAIYEMLYPCKIKFIELSHPNIKITYAKDLYLAEQLMKYQPVIKRIPEIANKRILVIGSTGGIGSALCEYLKNLKADVTGMNKKWINLNTDHLYLPNYLNDGKWDCIIHAAGAYCNDKEGLLDNYDLIMNVNFRSIVFFVEHAKELLNKGGSFIAIGSTAASKGRKGIALYSASKAALNTFIEGMTEPLKEHDIKLHVICPAKVATPLQKHINPNTNVKDMMKPEDIAKIIAGYIDVTSSGEIVFVKVGME
jgi:2-C-methyl-D-erythritol 4-phosphate cytidylyltransferase